MGVKSWSGRVRAVRERYGISQRSLGILLGISEPSIVRYEGGKEPSPSNARLLELAESPAYMRRCFEEAGRLLPAVQRASIAAALDVVSPQHDALGDASPESGFTAPDRGRIAAAMNYLSSLCAHPYYTRVIKACFVADFLSFERDGVSLLGLSYARAPHGPVIDGHQRIRRALEQSGDIELEDDGLGLLFVPSNELSAADLFSSDDLDLLDLAARFVDSFPTVGQLSEATHALPCWQTTANGKLIPYERGSEVWSFVEERLFEPSAELTSRLGSGGDEWERADVDGLFSEMDVDA